MTQLVMELPAGARINPPEMPIVVATAADSEDLAGVLSAAFPDQTWSRARANQELLEDLSVLHTLLALRGDRPVGTASAKRDDRFPGAGYVHWVGVDPAHRGSGIGAGLVLHIAASFGADEPVVLETDDERLPAIASYLGIGFVPRYEDDEHRRRWSVVFHNLAKYRKGRR